MSPTETAVSVAASTSIWGEVPKQCTWHTEPLARVAADLENAQLPVHFQLESTTEGWQLFSVKFDPAQVSTEQIRGILTNAGAIIIARTVQFPTRPHIQP